MSIPRTFALDFGDDYGEVSSAVESALGGVDLSTLLQFADGTAIEDMFARKVRREIKIREKHRVWVHRRSHAGGVPLVVNPDEVGSDDRRPAMSGEVVVVHLAPNRFVRVVAP